MGKRPDKRYQSAQEMLDAIEEFKRNPPSALSMSTAMPKITRKGTSTAW